MASATAEKQTSKRSTTAKAAGATPRGQYPDNVRAAAKRARELQGGNHGAGPKQHVIVRKTIGSQDPVEASGLSLARLTKYAQGKETPERDQLKPLRELATKCVNPTSKQADPFCKGRNLAAILVAYAEERKTASKS